MHILSIRNVSGYIKSEKVDFRTKYIVRDIENLFCDKGVNLQEELKIL